MADADADCASHDAERPALIARLVAQWPALPSMSFGLWCAWIALAYSGSTWLSLDTETNSANLAIFYVATTLTQAIALVVGAMLAARGTTRVASNRAVMLGGAVATVCCLGVLALGPHYLGQFIDTGISHALFVLCSLAIGAGMAFISLRCGCIFGSLTPRRALVNTGLSQLLAAMIFFANNACGAWAPVSGGPSVASFITFTMLPLGAAWLACQGPLTSATSGDEARADRRVDPQLPFSFWRLVTLAFLIALVTSLMRGAVVGYHALAVTLEGSTLLMVLRVILAAGFVLVGVCADTQHMRFGRITSLIAVFSSSVIAVAAALGGLASGWSILAYFASIMFDLVFWCLLSFFVRQKHVSPVAVYGIGRGAFATGSTIGWALGTWVAPLVPAGSPTTMLYVASAMALLVLSVVLFGERDYEALFTAVGERELPLEDLFDVELRRSAASEAGDGRREGAFRRAIEGRASRCMLSARERDVFRLLAMGYGSDYIAATLGLSVNTVRVHTHNVYVKLGVHSRTELMELVDRDVALEREGDTAVESYGSAGI